MSSIDDPVGSPSMDAVAVYNRVADFDPVSQSGQVNYGGDREPGWCDETIDPYTDDFSNAGCNQMPGGSPSNNLAAGAATVVPPAHHVPGVSKYFVQSTNQQLFPGSQYAGDGQGRISAGEGAYSQLNMWVGDSYGWKNYGICDVWDNSTMKLVPAQSLNNDAAPGTYATLQGAYIPGQYNGNQPNWIFQYGHFDTTGVDPFYNSALVAVTENSPTWPTTNTYNTNEQRFWGDWSALKSAANDCRQTNPSAGWFSDPNDVPGGIDEVNAVRIIAADPSLLVTEENPASFSFRIPLRARSQFYGGPNDGTAIPADVIVPNYSSVWGQNDNDDWHEPGSQFEPAPFNYGGYGDRVT
ncbi:MAG TPA: hypothetical protein PLC19_10890, partial [Marmoricola sp.]|nr:hypothetical protein [Marmoricola sp.]